VVYTKTSYSTNSSVGWKAAYSYASHTGYFIYLDESRSCRRDKVYTVPMCCQITIDVKWKIK
jgi:hypothetical protein